MQFFKSTPRAIIIQGVERQLQLSKNSLEIILSYLNPKDIKTFINFSYTSKEIYFLFRELIFLYKDQHHTQLIESSFKDLVSIEQSHKNYAHKLNKFKSLKQGIETIGALSSVSLPIGFALYQGFELKQHLSNCNFMLRVFSVSVTSIGLGVISCLPVLLGVALAKKFNPLKVIENKMENKLSKMPQLLFITPKNTPSKIAFKPNEGPCTML